MIKEEMSGPKSTTPIEIKDIKGRALNYAVAVTIENHNFQVFDSLWSFENCGFVLRTSDPEFAKGEYNPQGNWAHGGPIMEKYQIADHNLERAMRIFLAHNATCVSGSEIEIPNELLTVA